MAEPPVFKRGAMRRSGSASARSGPLDLLPAVYATPCADGVSVGARRPLSPSTADAGHAGEADGGLEKRQKVDADGAPQAPRRDGDPFAFEGSEAAPRKPPCAPGRSVLHLSGTPHARAEVRVRILRLRCAARARAVSRARCAATQGSAKHVTWGTTTIHITPARESPPRKINYAEPEGEAWPAAPNYVRANSVISHSGAQLAGAFWRTVAHRAAVAAIPRAELTPAALRGAAVDEARYALQCMAPCNSLDARRTAVVALTALAVDPDTRRLMRHHRLSPVFLVRAGGPPRSETALKLGCAGSGVRPSSHDGAPGCSAPVPHVLRPPASG